VDTEELESLLQTLRRFGAEPSAVEARSGAGGFPTSVRESLVAFANTDGGTVLIGVDEGAGFEVVDVPDPGGYRDRLVDLGRSAVTPPLPLETRFVELDGKRVVLAVVPELSADLKPAFVTSKGVTTGAYLRTGDGDRRMSEAEIALLYASRAQPAYDRERIDGASAGDLDRAMLFRTLDRVRLGSSYLRDVDDPTALHRLGVLSEPRADAPPTLAGLLTFGRFPQQHFPQLMISVVVYPPDDDEGTRFLDNATLRGPIPEIVAETLAFVRRNLAARAVNVGAGREEHLDLPLAAVREAVVNALLHRDYSPVTRGTQIQVELHPDRLVVRSPGGLYGPISAEDLGEIDISSSRNAVLAQLLSDVYLPRSEQLVAENRASGVPMMIRQAQRHGLPRPAFESRITTFTVTMGRSALLGPEVRAWLGTLPIALSSPAHEIAAAMMRGGGFVTNAALREWGVDRHASWTVLRELTDAGVAVRHGGRRYARYVLNPTLTAAPSKPSEDVATVLARLKTATAAQLQARTGLSRAGVVNQLNKLIGEGRVRSEGATQSPRRRYSWQAEPVRSLPEEPAGTGSPEAQDGSAGSSAVRDGGPSRS
jgi:ATP-dependent DNA helicase RecG